MEHIIIIYCICGSLVALRFLKKMNRSVEQSKKEFIDIAIQEGGLIKERLKSKKQKDKVVFYPTNEYGRKIINIADSKNFVFAHFIILIACFIGVILIWPTYLYKDVKKALNH